MNKSSQQAIADLLDKRDEIIAIAAKRGAFNIRVFGSVARNETNKDSDIDLLVDYSLDKISPWFRCWFKTRFKKNTRSQGRYSN